MKKQHAIDMGGEPSLDDDEDNNPETNKIIFTLAKSGGKEQIEKAIEEIKNKTQKKIKLKAILNQKDDLGNTPQHYAARDGHADVLEHLIKNDADIEAQGQNDLKVFHFAARYGQDEEKVWECFKIF